MSSTNKTSNYDLSQFTGGDKPAWLTDYNQDMSKIDAGIDAAQDAATAADGKASSNTTKIGDLSYLSTTAKTDLVAAINEVDSTAETATTTAGTASDTANTAALNAANAISGLNKFNLTSHSTLTPTASKGTVSSGFTVAYFSTDSTSSIFKVYGRVRVDVGTATGSTVVTLGNTTLRPDEPYTISSAVIMMRHYLNGTVDMISINLNVSTTGVITTDSISLSGIDYVIMSIPPCLYFNTNFGDTE